GWFTTCLPVRQNALKPQTSDQLLWRGTPGARRPCARGRSGDLRGDRAPAPFQRAPDAVVLIRPLLPRTGCCGSATPRARSAHAFRPLEQHHRGGGKSSTTSRSISVGNPSTDHRLPSRYSTASTPPATTPPTTVVRPKTAVDRGSRCGPPPPPGGCPLPG